MRTLLAGLLTVALAPVVGATVIVPAEFREIVAGAQLIVIGRVVDVRAEWEDGRRRINSYVTAEVASTLKGRAGGEVTFVVPGGQMGRYRTIVVGAPIFAPGDEAVLFLNFRAGAPPYVFGLNQGVFRIRADARGQRMVVPPALLARGEAPELIARGAAGRRPLALDAFNAQVGAVLAEIASGGAAR
jgi:hypothetical protein